MRSISIAIALALLGAAAADVALAQVVTTSADARSLIYTPSTSARRSVLSAQQISDAKSRMPILKDISQVPGFGAIAKQAYGALQHPFTTKGAYANPDNGLPTNIWPYRPTGKLFMEFGQSLFVCTASVIQKGVLVTAAHCVHNFGQGNSGFATRVYFQPARHGTTAPYTTRFGQWEATNWIVPSAYADGTDECTTTGVVCANDVAVVVLATGPSPFTGKEIAQVTGRYGYYVNNQGYTDFLGKKATQITQLGYPVAFDSGYKMIRTDSMGYQAAPWNVLIGSSQTGGSSGGPWLMNFGRTPPNTTSTPSFDLPNKVVATTSWGYIDSTLKIQGASRFANNSKYPGPGPTNIRSLILAACAVNSAKCN